jgi:hypothetical protein
MTPSISTFHRRWIALREYIREQFNSTECKQGEVKGSPTCGHGMRIDSGLRVKFRVELPTLAASRHSPPARHRPPRASCWYSGGPGARTTMPKDDTLSRASMTQTPGGPPAASWTQQQQSSIFSIPAPLKRIFDKFPLVQYDENELPLRAPKDKSQHVLHVFTTDKDAREGKPSFNPGCLKWQVWTMVNQGA